MIVNELVHDRYFSSLLSWLARNNNIRDFRDYRQEVFAEILDQECNDRKSAVRAANRIAKRMRRVTHEGAIMDYASKAGNGTKETEDEILSRLVYSGKGKVTFDGVATV